jgi:hypothetical protein
MGKGKYIQIVQNSIEMNIVIQGKPVKTHKRIKLSLFLRIQQDLQGMIPDGLYLEWFC